MNEKVLMRKRTKNILDQLYSKDSDVNRKLNKKPPRRTHSNCRRCSLADNKTYVFSISAYHRWWWWWWWYYQLQFK